MSATEAVVLRKVPVKKHELEATMAPTALEGYQQEMGM
jgi:hypothetical protein